MNALSWSFLPSDLTERYIIVGQSFPGHADLYYVVVAMPFFVVQRVPTRTITRTKYTTKCSVVPTCTVHTSIPRASPSLHIPWRPIRCRSSAFSHGATGGFGVVLSRLIRSRSGIHNSELYLAPSTYKATLRALAPVSARDL